MNKYMTSQNKSFIFINISLFLMVVILGTYNNLFYLGYLLLVGVGLFLLFNRWTIPQIAIYLIFPFLLMYQIYVSVIGTIDVPIAYLFLALFFTIYFLKLKVFNWIGRQKILLFYLFFMYVLLSSLLYSVDKQLGIKTFLYQSSGLFALMLGLYAREKGINIVSILNSIIIFGLPIAIFNIIFFFRSDLELIYLQSKIAQVLVQPDQIIHLFDTERNNILDPKKSGTVFVNTNVGAVFYQLLLWITIALFFSHHKKRYLLISFIYLLAFFATYSRAGLLAFVITLIAIVLLNLYKANFWTKILWLIGPACVLIILGLNYGIFTHMLERLRYETIINDPRFLIWAFAWNAFKEHPIMGLGFGGWEVTYPSYANLVGLDTRFPPHNIFIHLWAWSGIIGVFSFVFLLGYIIYKSIRLYRSKNNLQLALICSYLTVIIQGMFDNWFLNDYRILLLLFFLTGLLLYSNGTKKTKHHTTTLVE